jgi:hypothetical protein
MPDVNGVLQIEMRRQGRKIVGVVSNAIRHVGDGSRVGGMVDHRTPTP